MSIPFNDYAKFKDRYCLTYLGPANEYLLQIQALRPQIESQLPGVGVYIGYKDGLEYLFESQDRIVPLSMLKEKKRHFGCVRDIRCNMESHPVLDLMNESGLDISPIGTPANSDNGRCVIITKGILPTRSLTDKDIVYLTGLFSQKGYDVQINGNPSDAGLIVGVESEQLFSAAIYGKKTSLIDNGLGTELYERMFPHTGSVVKLEKL